MEFQDSAFAVAKAAAETVGAALKKPTAFRAGVGITTVGGAATLAGVLHQKNKKIRALKAQVNEGVAKSAFGVADHRFGGVSKSEAEKEAAKLLEDGLKFKAVKKGAKLTGPGSMRGRMDPSAWESRKGKGTT